MKLYCVVYRTGGTENYQWHRSLPMTHEEAVISVSNTEKMGYPAMMADYKLSLAIGLPETFSAEDKYRPFVDGELFTPTRA